MSLSEEQESAEAWFSTTATSGRWLSRFNLCGADSSETSRVRAADERSFHDLTENCTSTTYQLGLTKAHVAAVELASPFRYMKVDAVYQQEILLRKTGESVFISPIASSQTGYGCGYFEKRLER